MYPNIGLDGGLLYVMCTVKAKFGLHTPSSALNRIAVAVDIQVCRASLVVVSYLRIVRVLVPVQQVHRLRREVQISFETLAPSQRNGPIRSLYKQHPHFHIFYYHYSCLHS